MYELCKQSGLKCLNYLKHANSFSNSFSRISKVPAKFNEKLDFQHWVFETGLSPPIKYFTDRSKAALLLWIFYVVFFCLVFAMPLCASVCMCLVVTCWERADLLALVCDV